MDEAGLQAGKQLPAGGRQRDRAHAPLEQLEAEQILQSADLVAQRSCRHVQLFGRLGQAEMARRSLESAQGIERRQWPMHEEISFMGGENILCHNRWRGSM